MPSDLPPDEELVVAKETMDSDETSRDPNKDGVRGGG